MTLPTIGPDHVAASTGLATGIGEESLAARSQSARPDTLRVLHVINGEHYSGAERVQDLLAARLPEFGFEVGFACVKPGKFVQARQFREAPVYETPMCWKLDLRAALRVRGIARKFGYSLIHAHTPRSGLIARLASAICRIPMVYHVHSPTSRDSTRSWQNRMNQWTERISLFRVPAVVTVSNSLRQHMLQLGLAPERVITVRNGVPIPAVRRAHRRPTEPWTLGMAALFRPRKGLEVLLEALALLRQKDLPVRLHAVGPFESNAYETEIRSQIDRLAIGDLVTWTGFTSDVAGEFVKMDLFVLPSLFGEGLPMVVLEAMAAGVPVVATRVEGVPEAIEHGVSGMIAAPNDAVDLAHCIGRVIRKDVDWSALRQCAMSRHSAEFSDRRMASGLADVYRRVLATGVASVGAP
jgi:glycosyltransferase involved in cell wall biosynthesis